MLREVKHNLVLYTKYRVTKRYEGRALFIKAGEDIERFGRDLSNGFGEVMPQIQVVVMDGIHRSLLSEEQSVRQISQAIIGFVQGY